MSVTATDTTKNDGGDIAASSVTSFYLSSNASLDATDVLLARRAVPSLEAGLSNMGSTVLTVPASTTAGIYYLIARSDGDSAVAEALESNNTRLRTMSIAAAP